MGKKPKCKKDDRKEPLDYDFHAPGVYKGDVLIGHVFFMFYCPGTMSSQAESQKFRSTTWTGLTFTTHTTEQNRLALRVTGGQPGTTVSRYFG